MPDFLFSCLFPLVIKGKLPADEFRSSMNQDLIDATRATEVLHLNGACGCVDESSAGRREAAT